MEQSLGQLKESSGGNITYIIKIRQFRTVWDDEILISDTDNSNNIGVNSSEW